MPQDRRHALKRFGKLAIDNGYLTVDQLQECVKIQDNYERDGRVAPQIGVILIAKKYMTAAQVTEIIKLQNRELHSLVSEENVPLSFRSGEVIFHEQDENDHDLFFLRSGTVEFYRNRVLIELRSGVGVFFGVSGYLMKCPRTATAIAKTACDVLQIRETNANSLFRVKPDLAIRLASSLANSLRQTTDAYARVISGLPPQQIAIAAAKLVANAQPTPSAMPSSTPSHSSLASAATQAHPLPSPKIAPPKKIVAAAPITPIAPTAPIAPIITAKPLASVAAKTSPELPKTKEAPDKKIAPPIQTVSPVEPIATVAKDSPPASSPTPPTPTAVAEKTSPQNSAVEKNSADVAAPISASDSKLPTSADDDDEITDASVGEKSPDEKSEDDFSFTIAADAKFSSADELLVSLKKIAVKPISAAARDGVKKRIALYLQIEQLEEQRVALEQKYPEASESFKIEIARQRREYLKIPALNILQTQLEKVRDKLKNSPVADAKGGSPVAAAPTVDAAAAAASAAAAKLSAEEEQQKKLERAKKALGSLGGGALEFLDPADFADTEFADDEPEEAAPETPAEPTATAAKLPPITRDMSDLLTIGVKQRELLITRAETTPQLLGVCFEAASNEPFAAVLKKMGVDPKPLFGWGILAYALKNYAETANEKIKEIRKRTVAINEKKAAQGGGFLGMGGNKVDEETAKEIEDLANQEKKWKLISTNISRDSNANEPEMVGVFWNTYENLGGKYTQIFRGISGVLIRGFLRWGMLGISERWLARNQLEVLINDCFADPSDPTNRLEETALYYADEVIYLSSNGKLAPSPNEDLELNHRNSNEWKVDRAWRKLINSAGYEVALKQILGEQSTLVEEARKNVAQLEDMVEKTKATNHPDKKKIIVKIRDQMQNDKVKAARAEKTIERLNVSVIPYNLEEVKRSQEVLDEIKVTPQPPELAKHEISCLRRNARLVAKLKEPFLPFSLRDRFKPEMNCANTKAAMLTMLKDVEVRDPIIFLDPLIPNAKKIHQVFMRRSPVMIIAPASGVLGFIMGPRQGQEGGRFVLPGYVERANMREEILWSTLSDFRYDTSKVSAGVDLMTSDTLVAAYAAVRWNLRKREREARQKAGIYTEENERTNFRRHYALYMKSAMDSGKLLFFKCPELYELVVNKFIDLPAGVTILKR